MVLKYVIESDSSVSAWEQNERWLHRSYENHFLCVTQGGVKFEVTFHWCQEARNVAHVIDVSIYSPVCPISVGIQTASTQPTHSGYVYLQDICGCEIAA